MGALRDLSNLAVVAALSLCACKGTALPQGKARFITAAAEPERVDLLVTQTRQASSAEHRTLLVYAGATWCEPCRHFHEAVEAGKLDAEFGTLDFLAFDVDRDNERLAFANYNTGMIPLLAVPDEHGRGNERFMSGSIKGDGAVAEMTPRLKALLQR